jgi:hypothetical protein
MFLLPPFSGWAFNVLNTAPLTKLDLIEVRLQPLASALIFGALTIPTLEHLRIISCQVDFDAVAEFLSRHNTISTFDIIFQSVHHWQLPITTLPALVLLKSNPNIIGELLAPGAFPKLAQVRVVIHPSPSDQLMFDAVENSLARAAKRLKKTNIRLCLDVLPSPFTTNVPNLETLPSGVKNDPVLSRVREIIFGFPRPDVLPTTTIPTLFSMFPLLERIEFLNAQGGDD